MTATAAPVYRLIDSTSWRIGATAPAPIHITLACRHVLTTTSRDLTDVLRQTEARPVVHEQALRMEMRCTRCENVGERVIRS